MRLDNKAENLPQSNGKLLVVEVRNGHKEVALEWAVWGWPVWLNWLSNILVRAQIPAVSAAPCQGSCARQPIDVSLWHQCLFFSLSLLISSSLNNKINKHILKKEWVKWEVGE